MPSEDTRFWMTKTRNITKVEFHIFCMLYWFLSVDKNSQIMQSETLEKSTLFIIKKACGNNVESVLQEMLSKTI